MMKIRSVIFLTIFLFMGEGLTFLQRVVPKIKRHGMVLLLTAVVGAGIVGYYLKKPKRQEEFLKKYNAICASNRAIVATIEKADPTSTLLAKKFIPYGVKIFKKENIDAEKNMEKNNGIAASLVNLNILFKNNCLDEKNICFKDVIDVKEPQSFNPYLTNRFELYIVLLKQYDKFCFRMDDHDILDIQSIEEYVTKYYVIEIEGNCEVNIRFFSYFIAILLYVMKKHPLFIENEIKVIELLEKQCMNTMIQNVKDRSDNFLLYSSLIIAIFFSPVFKKYTLDDADGGSY